MGPSGSQTHPCNDDGRGLAAIIRHTAKASRRVHHPLAREAPSTSVPGEPNAWERALCDRGEQRRHRATSLALQV